MKNSEIEQIKKNCADGEAKQTLDKRVYLLCTMPFARASYEVTEKYDKNIEIVDFLRTGLSTYNQEQYVYHYWIQFFYHK